MDGPQFTDCMVDVETTGLQGGKAALIQIGAVPFNFDTKEIDVKNMYCASLSIPRNRYWTDDTMKFWMGDNPEVYMKIMESARPRGVVIPEFYQWALERGNVRWWSKGFMDWEFIDSYMMDADLPMPFNFRQAKCMRSFIAGLNGEAEYQDPVVDKVGDHHNALHDCLTQLKQLFKAKEDTCQTTVVSD